MKQLVDKYAHKIVAAGLAEAGAPLIGGLDAELVWNRPDPNCAELEKVFAGLNINSLLFSQLAEPYRSIISYLARHSSGAIQPSDCETRTMMHDLPVIPHFEADAIVHALKRRKSVIIQDQGIVTWGTVSPEQAFIFFSSLCFACYVKFFSDCLADSHACNLSAEQRSVLDTAIPLLDDFPDTPPPLMMAPLTSEDAVYRAVIEAGRVTVDYHLVDSFFGNVSYRYGDTLYITQTGSSLDELEGCIDPCPLDGSSCAGITASSELTAHREIVVNTGMNARLAWTPPSSASFFPWTAKRKTANCSGNVTHAAEKPDLSKAFLLYRVKWVPAPTACCNTLPPAMQGHRGVIVYGHGLFTVAQNDFNEAFANLLDIEKMCRKLYFEQL